MSPSKKSASRPQSWSVVQPADLSTVRGVCFDIDDTFSSEGKITDEAFSALWELKRAGFGLVPITGRPAGWCDHFARFWPVDAVVGENGAFTFFMEKGVRKRLDTPGVVDDPKPALARLEQKIRAQFPKARWASDQSYREYDLAIDICEGVPPWPEAEVDALLALCAGEGAHAKLSSIHVNAWFGDYDKRRGFEHWLEQGAPGYGVEMPSSAGRATTPGTAPQRGEWIFIGDSPNDEPLFAAFEYSVGVSNLSVYLDRLKTPPRWITENPSGGGFAEMARKLVTARGAKQS